MRNIFKTLAILSVLSLTYSCDKNPDNIIYELDPVDPATQVGAVLRTIEIENILLNSSNPDSFFSVTVEEQDSQGGDLMESVDVYVSFRDLSPDNGATPASEAKVKTIAASEFTTGPVDLPRASIKMTFGEATAAMGLSPSDYVPGDVYVVELRLNLTDGRVFGASSSSNVLSGVYFNAPFKYNALLTCSPKPGDYMVTMEDSFGDGWQTDDGNGGHGLTCNIDGTDVQVGMCSYWDSSPYVCTPWPAGQGPGECGSSYCYKGPVSATVTIPSGTETASWTFPGDAYGEIKFSIYAPDGSLLFSSGDFGDTGPGLLPVTNCL